MTTAELTTTWDDWTRLARPRSAVIVGAAVAAGVAMDLALRNGPPTISGFVLVAVVSCGLLVSARPQNPQALAAIAAAPLFGAWLAIRTSVWLTPFDFLVSGALLVLGALYARGGSVLDLSVPALLGHGFRSVVHAFLAPGFLVGERWRRTGAGAMVRGVLLAIPLVLVVGALLASADAVFASAVRFDATELLSHVIPIAIGVWGMAWLARIGSADHTIPIVQGEAPRLGRTEWTIVLGSLDLLLAGFAAARIVAMTEGGRRIIATEGLTYAEYARTGFFQLLAASLVAFGALLLLRPLVEQAAVRRFRALAVTAVALLLLVVAQAVQRLFLYERAFGLTMPRLIAIVTCVWLALSLVALAVWICGVGAGRHWFWTATSVTALALLFALNAVNAEALVVRRNAARAETTNKFDTRELSQLGSDAVPALEEALPRLPADLRREVVTEICSKHPEHPRGIWRYNGSRDGAVEARNRVCSRRSDR